MSQQNKLLDKNTIIELLRMHSKQIKSYDIQDLGLFGSHIRGDQSRDSDIDVIVEFKEGQKTYKKFIGLTYFLESILHKQVDLLTFQSITPRFRDEIEKEITYVPLSA